MKWDEIKDAIIDDLTSRGLKDPSIRLRALDRIEAIMQQFYPSYIKNPEELEVIGKEEFKHKISEKKGKSLNSAESSVINEIYYKISPQQMCPAPKAKYRICICPYCFTSHQLTEDLWEYKTLTCLQCGNTIQNPIKEEERLKQIERGFLISGMLTDILKIILWSIFLIFILFMLFSCHNPARNSSDNQKIGTYTTSGVDSILCIIQKNDERLIGIWADDFTNGILWRIQKTDNGGYLLEMGSVDSDK